MANKKTESGFDDLFVVAGAMIPDNGEDSWLCALGETSAIAAVFDGSGGLGAKKYRNFSGKTGAFIASRIVSGAASDWYHEEDRAGRLARDGFRTFPECIRRGFAIAKAGIDERIRVSGSMTREFPTTAAAAIMIPVSGKEMDLHLLWAGDSRVYLLTPGGLLQVTRDDLDEMDAYLNITSDGVMNNVIAADGQTKYHVGGMTIQKPFVIMAATDGCFGYIRTPMEFEYMILHCLQLSKTPEEFRQRLFDSMDAVAEDDFTLSFAAAGFGSFDRMKAAFAARTKEIAKKYAEPLEKARTGDRTTAQESERQLWEIYRTGYERVLRDSKAWNYFETIH